MLDTAAGELWSQSRLISLSPKQLAALEMLVARAGVEISRAEIERTLWPGSATAREQLVQVIYWLRKTLAQGSTEVFIVAVPDGGYRFAAPVEVVASVPGGAGLGPSTETASRPAVAPAISGPSQELVSGAAPAREKRSANRRERAASGKQKPMDDEKAPPPPMLVISPAKIIPAPPPAPAANPAPAAPPITAAPPAAPTTRPPAPAASALVPAPMASPVAKEPAPRSGIFSSPIVVALLAVVAIAAAGWLLYLHRQHAAPIPSAMDITPAQRRSFENQIARDSDSGDLTALRGDLESATTAAPDDRGFAMQLAETCLAAGACDRAVQAARTRLALRADNPTRLLLGKALNRDDHPQQARAVLRDAVSNGDDDWAVHEELLKAAYMLGDDAEVQAQLAAGRRKGEDYRVTSDAAWLAAAAGKFRQAVGLWDLAAAQATAAGAPRSGTGLQGRAALMLFFAGDMAGAKMMLAPLPPAAWNTAGAVTQALLGEGPSVEQWIRSQQQAMPQSTLENGLALPEERAALDISSHDYQAAVRELDTARPYDRADETAGYLRGLALLAHGDGVSAEHEFQALLDHRGVEPLSPVYALAQLGVARAQHMQGRNKAAKESYPRFFEMWKNADTGLPVLTAAHAEAAALQQ